MRRSAIAHYPSPQSSFKGQNAWGHGACLPPCPSGSAPLCPPRQRSLFPSFPCGLGWWFSQLQFQMLAQQWGQSQMSLKSVSIQFQIVPNALAPMEHLTLFETHLEPFETGRRAFETLECGRPAGRPAGSGALSGGGGGVLRHSLPSLFAGR